MIILLRWLADFAWIAYAACALGVLTYVIRALAAQRRMSSTLTGFEREMAVAHILRLWRVAATFLLVGIALFAAQLYLLPRVLPDVLVVPTPTPRAGLETATPTPAVTVASDMGLLPLATSTPTPEPSPTPEGATPEPTVPPLPAPTYPLYARIGNVAELLGYDLSSTEVVVGQPIRLTLYWRALGGAGIADYWVFTHLVPPDLSRIVAQHDGRPAGGTRPTTIWVTGEIVVDEHELAFVTADYSGVAQLAVGIYVPDVGRVPVEGGGDYILLPTPLNVTAP
jgi:uncharacterized membrane protein YgdD (TMEM256/DUF423 family)